MAWRSAVKQPKGRTGSSSRSSGTATQCSSEPISMPAASLLMIGNELKPDFFRDAPLFFFLCCIVQLLGWLVRPGPGRSNSRVLLNGIASPMGQPKTPGTMLEDGYSDTSVNEVLAARTYCILSYRGGPLQDGCFHWTSQGRSHRAQLLVMLNQGKV